MIVPIITEGKAITFAVVSIVAVPFMIITGILFDVNAPTLVDGHEDTKTPAETAKNCYICAALYAVVLAFSLSQVRFIRKYQIS